MNAGDCSGLYDSCRPFDASRLAGDDTRTKEVMMSGNDYIAVVDMGSNAIRLAIGERGKSGYRRKIRIPIRLGVDVFSSGLIQQETLKKLVDAFKLFKKNIESCHVDHLRVVATSAVRNARNKQAIIEIVQKYLDVELEVIDGTQEAVLVHHAVNKAMDIEGQAVLMDVGGGSVEIIGSYEGDLQKMISLPLGTLRVFKHLRKNDNKAVFKFVEGFRGRVEEFIDEIHFPIDILVGIGGSVECLLDLRKKILSIDSTSSLCESELKKITKKLLSMNVKNREKKLGMNPDRSDVIVQACYICKMMMEVSQCSVMAIPGVGLRDGVLWEMSR